MKEKQKKQQTLKQSPVLTGLSFLHATLLLAPVPALLYGLIGAGEEELTRQYWSAALLIVPVILSWLAVRYCQALWLYALTGIAATVLASFAVPVVVGAVVIPASELEFLENSPTTAWLFSMAGKLTAGGLTALLWVVRGSARIRKGKIRKELTEMPIGENAAQIPELSEIPTFLDEPRAIHFAFFALCYLISLPLGEDTLYRYIFGLLFADIPVCFLYCYLASFRAYVEEHQSIANLPVQAMKKIIHLLLVPALLILLLVMIPSLLYGEEPLTRVHIDLSSEGPAPARMTETPVQGNDMTQEVLSQLSGGEAARIPAWIETLLEMAVWCILAAAAFLVLRALYRMVRSMNRSFLKEEEDEITFLVEEDHREKQKRKQSQGVSRFFLTPGEQIRKKYKKTLRRANRRGRKLPKGTETPAELELLAGLAAAPQSKVLESAVSLELPPHEADGGTYGKNTDLETLHTLYEKARYSPIVCTPEEARRVSDLKL